MTTTLHSVSVDDQIEQHIETARAELGNAGFAAAVGETTLALEALDIAANQIAQARQLLA